MPGYMRLAPLLILLAAAALRAQEPPPTPEGTPDYSAWKVVRVFGSEKFRHDEWITSVVIAPDGKWCVSGSWDKTARSWDLATGNGIKEFKGHEGLVRAVALSPDAKTLLTGSPYAYDKFVRAWKTEDASDAGKVEAFGAALAFTSDGKRFVASTFDGPVRLLEFEGLKELRQFKGHGDAVQCLALSPDNKLLLTGSIDTTARLWDVETGAELKKYESAKDEVTGVGFTPDGKVFLTACDDQFVRVFRFPQPEELPKEKVADLLKALGAEDNLARETAETELVKIGPAAQRWVLEAAEKGEPEVQNRAKRILPKYRIALMAEEVSALDIGGPIRALALHPKLPLWGAVVVTDKGTAIFIGTVPDGKEPPKVLAKIPYDRDEHESNVLAWLPDGNGIVTGNKDGSLTLYAKP